MPIQARSVETNESGAKPQPQAADAGRILLLCQHFYPEMVSTGMHMTELASALVSIGWQVTVYCAQPSLDVSAKTERVRSRIRHNNVDIRRLPALGSHQQSLIWRVLFALTYSLFSAVAALWRRREYDVIVITTNPPLLPPLVGMAAFLVRRPYVLILYDIYPDTAASLGEISPASLLYRVWQWVSRAVILGADANIIIGRDMAAVVEAKCGGAGRRTDLIPNWSDEQVVAPLGNRPNRFRALYAQPDTLIVQYSGRIGRIHNVEVLLDAAERLKDANVLVQFIGNGVKRRPLEESARRRGLANVQFLDYQPLSELGESLAAADLAVVCLSSGSTGLSVPSKAYGIMAAGRPILGLMDHKSEIGRAIEEHDCGVVIENADGAKVAGAIGALLADKRRLTQMGQNARRAFEGNYTLTAAARRYDGVLRAVLARRQGLPR